MAINKEDLISENTILYVDQVRKSYGKKRVLKNMSFSIERGKIVGFLGPNGCGKTTLVKLINGLIPVTDGVIMVGGNRIGKETKAIISYLPERTYLNNWMRVKDILDFFEDLFEDFDRHRAELMFSDMKIDLDEKLKNLSKGTKEKVQLVLVMSRQAELYILDEPTTGLHFEDINILLGVLQKLVDKGNTVIVIEHNLDVIKVADYLIDMGPEGGKGGGQLLTCGTPEEVALSDKGYTPAFVREELGLK